MLGVGTEHCSTPKTNEPTPLTAGWAHNSRCHGTDGAVVRVTIAATIGRAARHRSTDLVALPLFFEDLPFAFAGATCFFARDEKLARARHDFHLVHGPCHHFVDVARPPLRLFHGAADWF